MVARATEIGDILRQQIVNFEQQMTITNVGTVISVGDGIASVYGLSDVMASELVEFTKTGTIGFAFNLEEDSVGVIVLGDYLEIEEGDEVRATGHVASVPVGDALIGRVVDALGRPIDGKGPIQTDKTRPIERVAPGVIARENVDTALQTGIKAIDAMIPIGRGQRELIIGDRQTGKSAIAVDAIINQKHSDVICIYVAIGQKRAQVAQTVRILEENGAMDHTIVVAAAAADPAPLQFIAPFAGTSMGEEFMETGRDALIVYDDLSKHAQAYREVSLLMRRPPGREAYPGDVFYLHSRLLERSARLSEANGGGSLTSLPLIETQASDVSAYIPTNVISITDGQIYLEPDLFYAGVRPAINAGLSVSRVGGAAQIKAMRQVAGRMRLDLAGFRSLAAFAQFGTEDLDPATRNQIDTGQRLTEILKQPQYQPMVVEEQVAVLWAATNGMLSDVPVDRVREFETGYLDYLRTSHPGILNRIAEEKALSDELIAELRRATEEFKTMSPFAEKRPVMAAAAD
ncbi:MAG TPA: F0F1 ATP synthase subunit alpha [Thermomicrobiales bacterium]|nr:F0F1 ATP synthase subunit alpha [Thermomicrobiales bacterium]